MFPLIFKIDLEKKSDVHAFLADNSEGRETGRAESYPESSADCCLLIVV